MEERDRRLVEHSSRAVVLQQRRCARIAIDAAVRLALDFYTVVEVRKMLEGHAEHLKEFG